MAWTTAAACWGLADGFSRPMAQAGTQVGYAFPGRRWPGDVLSRPPAFNINSVALAAACAALDDRDLTVAA